TRRGIARAGVDRIDQGLATFRLLLLADLDQLALLGHHLQLVELSRYERQGVARARMHHRFRPEAAVRPGQQHVEDYTEQRRVALRQSLLQLLGQPTRQIAVGRGLRRVHRDFAELLVVGRQHVATDVLQLEEDRERQDATQHAL